MAQIGEDRLLSDGGLAWDTCAVSVVMPCLNEEESVGECVEEALAALAQAGLAGEVVVVDNNSTDRSAEIAVSKGARVIRESRPGYGSALLAGIGAANGPLVVMADADLSYDLRKIPRLIEPILTGSADIVLGERISDSGKGTMPFLHKRVGTPALTLLVKRASGGLTLKDSQSGFRAFRKGDIMDLALGSSGMEFASEMLIRAAQRGLRIAETSTGYRVRSGSSKLNPLSDGWRHVREILRLAPNLALVLPGAVLAVSGFGLQILSLVLPSGVDVGSLRWQPNFAAGVLLVVGVQAILAGKVLARSTRASRSGRTGEPTDGISGLVRRSFAIGVSLLVIGIGLDVGLFVQWIEVRHTFTRALALGGMAQSLLIIGTVLTGFGILNSILTGKRGS